MYVPHQFQVTLAVETTPDAERRAADQQLGRISAAMSRKGRNVAGQMRALARSRSRASDPLMIFRKTDPETDC
jgi:hypothetical protein